MVVASTLGLTEESTTENSAKINDMEREPSSGRMEPRMKATSTMGKEKAMVDTLSQMEVTMWEVGLMEGTKDLENATGRMEEFTKASGEVVWRMVKVSRRILTAAFATTGNGSKTNQFVLTSKVNVFVQWISY
jgi:hypothetical protein